MIFLLLYPELVGFRKIKQRINTDERVGFLDTVTMPKKFFSSGGLQI
jgi:hypothetical protein